MQRLLGTDLDAPLGQDRKPRAARRLRFAARRVAFGRLALGRLALGLGGFALVAVSTIIALYPTGLTAPKPVPVEPPAEIAAAAKTRAEPEPDQAMSSGANVKRTTTDDGSVVTMFSPGTSSNGGPAIIEVEPVRGQDARVAAQPNEALLEDSPEGRLPVVGPDGLRPMDQYARPWSGARGTRIALVVGGLGLSQTGTQNAIRKLSPDVTLAFAASGNSLQRWMQDARNSGHEILLQLPLEPFDYPANDPGPHTLLVDAGTKKNLAELRTSLARITNYTGVMNFLGGKFLSDADAMEPVLRDIGRRGLLFLDDGTSAQSLTGTVSDALDLPHGFGDLVLDGQLDRTAILKKLDDLERIARRNGTAIGTASAFDESVAAIDQWMDEAASRGIEFVGVSALVKDPKRR